MSISAEQQIHAKFIEATKYVPQVPHGCVDLGGLALRLDAKGKLPWARMLRLPLEGEALDEAVHRTNEVHARVRLPANPDLRKSLPFAFELVRADLASSFPAVEKQGTIEPISSPLVRRSAIFMQDAGRRAFAAHALDEASTVLHSREIRRGIREYQIAILGVAQHYRGSTDASGRMRAMDTLRQSVTDLTRGPITDRLVELQGEAPLGLDMAKVAHSLTRWQPSQELVAKHFS